MKVTFVVRLLVVLVEIHSYTSCKFRNSVQLRIGNSYKGKIVQSQGMPVKFYVCKRFRVQMLHNIFGGNCYEGR